MSKSRNLATLLGSDGSVKTTKYVDEKGGVADFVASGTLPNGVPVVLKDDGTVSAVGTLTTGSAQSIPAGAEHVFNSASSSHISVAFDPNNAGKFVLSYFDGASSNNGMIVVGTITGTSINFGNVVTFSATNSPTSSVAFDPFVANQFVIVYHTYSGGYSGRAKVGTISGTTISFGTEVVFDAAGENAYFTSIVFDPNYAGRFVVMYRQYLSSQNRINVLAGTVTGTTTSYEPVVQYQVNNVDVGAIAFDPNTAGKFIIAYKSNNTITGEVVVGTFNGTVISLHTASVFNSSRTEDISIAFDTFNANKFVVVYKDYTNAHKGKAKVGTISGNTVSFGTEVIFNEGYTRYTSVAFDPFNANKFVVSYDDPNGVGGAVNIGTVSGTSITFSGEVAVNTSLSVINGVVFDPNTAGDFIAFYTDSDNSNYGTVVLNRLSTPIVVSTNLTADNFIGMSSSTYADAESATIVLAGGVSDNQTGLTTNSVYYVQTDGTLTTTAGTPSVEAGRAISSTSLLLTSEAGAAGASGGAAGVMTSGNSLPATIPEAGTFFFKTDDKDVYVSNGTDWERVASAVPNMTSATGGTITTTATHKIHTFTTSGMFEVTGAGDVEYLVIAGGGGGSAGGSRGGGAGAGGYRTNVDGQLSGGGSASETALTLGVATYTIIVGAGGAGAGTDNADGIQGSDSSIATVNITSLGGGKAAIGGGVSGGSGSGASGSVYSLVGGSGTTGQGFAGGNATSVNPYAGGGGGGAGAVGVSYSGSQSGSGGAGVSSSITGTSFLRAGGGGGAATTQGAAAGLGGSGGGGNGGALGHTATSGMIHTGSGGGSASNENPPPVPAGSGGSGIVIIRYAL